MSPTPFFRLGWLLALALACFAGCGGGEEESSNGGGGKEEEVTPMDEGVQKRDPSKLPKLGDYLPPLAGGVEVAPPDGWSPLARDSKYLARFYHKERTSLPRIEITVTDSPVQFTDVAPENVAEFAAAMKPESTKNKRNVIEPCIPMIFGDSAWSRHVRLAKYKSEKVQVQSLQTVRKGKLYTIDLIIEGEEPENMKEYKDYGYAVAAGMKFGGGDATPAPMPENAAPAAPEPDVTPAP